MTRFQDKDLLGMEAKLRMSKLINKGLFEPKLSLADEKATQRSGALCT
jgi:hypothetical protein